jgi:Pvc16 N-terminal domain
VSNTLAVATVTEALKLYLHQEVSLDVPAFAVDVTARRPPTELPDDPTITIFLYQVTPNAALRNADAPTRATDATMVRRPVAALDLHYLISFYGDESQLVPQRLLGSVVRALHELPVLPTEFIEQAAQQPYLDGSDLATSPQRVRFTPTSMDIDDTSKLWGMLYQTPYALSVAYQGVAVLIEGRGEPVAVKQVETRTVRAVPSPRPVDGS